MLIEGKVKKSYVFVKNHLYSKRNYRTGKCYPLLLNRKF